MTIVIVCVSTLMCAAFATFTMGVTSAYSLRARAQIAADSAALAAVAESTIYGSGDPRSAAAEFAGLNGAELVRCLCEPASTAVQVTVSVDEVVARARAVFEPDDVGPAGATLGTQGLHPLLKKAVDELLRRSDGAVVVTSGFRSSAEQVRLWQGAMARFGDPEVADDWVAPPGTSMHEKGLAVDLGGDLELAVSLVRELGLPLVRPLANEPWHFELDLGGRGNL